MNRRGQRKNLTDRNWGALSVPFNLAVYSMLFQRHFWVVMLVCLGLLALPRGSANYVVFQRWIIQIYNLYNLICILCIPYSFPFGKPSTVQFGEIEEERSFLLRLYPFFLSHPNPKDNVELWSTNLNGQLELYIVCRMPTFLNSSLERDSTNCWPNGYYYYYLFCADCSGKEWNRQQGQGIRERSNSNKTWIRSRSNWGSKK